MSRSNGNNLVPFTSPDNKARILTAEGRANYDLIDWHSGEPVTPEVKPTPEPEVKPAQ